MSSSKFGTALHPDPVQDLAFSDEFSEERSIAYADRDSKWQTVDFRPGQEPYCFSDDAVSWQDGKLRMEVLQQPAECRSSHNASSS